MRKLVVFLLMAVIFTFAGCAKKKEVVNLDAEKAKVEAVLDQLNQALEIEDIGLVANITGQDNDLIVIGTAPEEFLIGWNVYRDALNKQFELFESTKLSVVNRMVKVHASGNIAWFSEIMDVNYAIKGKSFILKGVRVSGVLEKRDDNWVLVQSHASIPVAERLEKKDEGKKGEQDKTTQETQAEEVKTTETKKSTPVVEDKKEGGEVKTIEEPVETE